MGRIWEIVRVGAALLGGYGMSYVFDVSGWVILWGYLLGASHMHLAHMAQHKEGRR